MSTDLYSEITNRIVAALEAGVQPWSQPWLSKDDGFEFVRPLRANGEPYQGINVIMLWMTASEKNYTNPYWMTFRQAKELGGNVRSGEKSTRVVYASRIVTDDEKLISFLRSYNVFNCQQIDGLPKQYYPKKPDIVVPAAKVHVPSADIFFDNLGATVIHGGSRAFYHSTSDTVHLPDFDTFLTPLDYYSTRAHEMVHWTQTEQRTDRNLGVKRWGDEGYAMEELVAELGAAFLMADLGLAVQPRADHANYIATWLKVLKNDHRAIFSTASLANKAVKYMHSLQPV